MSLKKLAFVSAATLLACFGPMHAADVVKANNTNVLSGTSAWTAGAVPTSADIAVWDATQAVNRNNQIGGNVSFGGIKVANPLGTAYQITTTASSTLTIGSSGIDLSSATADLTISAILDLSASQTWTVGAGRTLTVNNSANVGNGTITLAGSGTFRPGSAGGLGSGTVNLEDGITVAKSSGGVTSLGNFLNLNGNIGMFVDNSNALNLKGGMNIGSGNRTIAISTASTGGLVFAGGTAAGDKQISGSGVLVLANGNVGLSPINVAFGATTGTDAFITVNSDLSIGSNISVNATKVDTFTSSSDLTVQTSGTFNIGLASTSYSQTFGSLSGEGVFAKGSHATTVTLTIDGGARTTTTTFSGNVVDTGTGGRLNIQKLGTTTQVFAGTNTYGGQTVVSAGTLLINGVHSEGTTVVGSLFGYGSATAGHFQVENAAKLGGSGRISGNTSANNSNLVLVQSGGVLAPGASIGTLVLDGANIGGTNSRVLNMASGSDFAFELAGSGATPDRVDFWNYSGGDLLLNANEINLTLVGPIVAGTYTVSLFRFFSDNGITAVSSGLVAGLTVGAVDSNISGVPTINFNSGGSTIDITYTVVPEPSVVLLSGLGLGLALWRARRRA